MRTGLLRCKDSVIFCRSDGGADALNAIKGTSVNALSPPILVKAVQKSDPLIILALINYYYFINCTIQVCNVPHLQP